MGQITKWVRNTWLAGLVASSLLTACLPKPTVNTCPLGYIPVGVILTSETIVDGQEQREGYQLALSEINPAGIQGCPIRLITDTSEGEDKNPDAVQKAMLNLKDQNVVAILGAVSNDASKRAAAISTFVQIPVVITPDTADDMMDTNSQWVFRINPSNKSYVSAGLDMAKTALGAQVKVGIVYEHSEYGESAAAVAGDAALNRDLSVSAYIGYNTATQDFTTIVTQLKNAKPDVIYLVSTQTEQAQAILNLIRTQKLPVSFVIANGITSRNFLYDQDGKVNTNLEHIILTVPWSTDRALSGSQKFAIALQTYRLANKINSAYIPSSRNVQAYVALHLVADAINETAKAMPTWLSSLNNSDSINQARLSLNQALHNYKSNGFNGLSWPLNFDVNGQNNIDASLVQVINGKLVTIIPKPSSAINPIFPFLTTQ